MSVSFEAKQRVSRQIDVGLVREIMQDMDRRVGPAPLPQFERRQQDAAPSIGYIGLVGQTAPEHIAKQ